MCRGVASCYLFGYKAEYVLPVHRVDSIPYPRTYTSSPLHPKQLYLKPKLALHNVCTPVVFAGWFVHNPRHGGIDLDTRRKLLQLRCQDDWGWQACNTLVRSTMISCGGIVGTSSGVRRDVVCSLSHQAFKLLLKNPAEMKSCSGFLARGLTQAVERYNRGKQTVRAPSQDGPRGCKGWGGKFNLKLLLGPGITSSAVQDIFKALPIERSFLRSRKIIFGFVFEEHFEQTAILQAVITCNLI